jgi:hypothetical protein
MAVNGEIMRVDVEYSVPGSSQVLNVFHWRIEDSVPDDEVLEDWEVWVTNEWGPAWADTAASSASIIAVAVRVMSSDGTVVRVVGASNLTPIDGDLGGEVQAAHVAGHIHAPTLLPRSRGRKFIPGIAESVLGAGGIFQTSVLTNYVVLGGLWTTQYAGEISSADYTPGLLRIAATSFQPFLGTVGFTDRPRSQRRRMGDVGA